MWYNPFPHTTNVQQTTLKIFGQKYGNSLKVLLLNGVKNNVAKGEIAHYE